MPYALKTKTAPARSYGGFRGLCCGLSPSGCRQMAGVISVAGYVSRGLAFVLLLAVFFFPTALFWDVVSRRRRITRKTRVFLADALGVIYAA